MSSKIPSLIRPTNLRKPSAISNQINSGTNGFLSEAKHSLNKEKNLKNENKENYLLTSKLNSQATISFKVPRVAYLSDRSQNNISSTGIKYSSKIIARRESSDNQCNRNNKSQNILNQNIGKSKPSVKRNDRNDIKYLSIRQQNLIRERELRLENTKLKLEEIDNKHDQELLFSGLIESELKLQLEYLDENNYRYMEEIKTIQEFEKTLICEIANLENQFNEMEFAFSNLRDINTIKSLNDNFKLQNLDIEQTIQLLHREISECDNSIKFYELEGDDGELIVKNLRVPFNKSIEYALNLEKLLQNDKLLINQLQFRLHKLTKSPKFICRTYSSEIPQLSKVHISIPPCENKNTISYSFEENNNFKQFTTQKDEKYIGKDSLKLDIDIGKSQFSIGKEIIRFDKIIEFDDTKRPSSLLLTDLSKIDQQISDIIEKIDEPQTNMVFQPKINNTNNIIRRQSLLHSKMDFELKKNSSFNIDSPNNIDEKSTYYLVDINEQKEVEMDILLLINDFFNSIKLIFSEKNDLNDKSKRNTSHSFEVPSIFIANIGSNSTASRQTFWGTNNGRLVLINDGISEYTERYKIKNLDNKIPGILHSVIYQIYQNINHSSLFNWKLSATILMQKSIYKSENVENDFNHVDSRIKQLCNNGKPLVFNGGLTGYVNPEQKCFSDSFTPFNYHLRSNNNNDSSREIHCSDPIYKSETITNCEFKHSDDFISQIYKEIQALSPNFLGSINAYFLNEEELANLSEEHPVFHCIIILKIEAITLNSSISSNIVLTDFCIDENGAADNNIVDYLSIVKGNRVNNKFMDNIFQLRINHQTEPLIYTLVHSNI
ncbi:uncharacterized protein cubi_02959 [Cryptosporidium ubiquitum]|uniref:Uncharacterized protein n=1 Tax=Cryptosporidium ubiquitum TaxID=857276 RepID=A0A1J4MMR2_9CRYT|nr:uncharacterized protein cubi_02959 [Cryptosporidium ubiquitum]OII74157.1 hypothetical protein cubi_02959 [Cryptosporidium ubiquitum]